MEKLTFLASLAALAAFVPAFSAARPRFWTRLVDRFVRKAVAPVAPPETTVDHGWTLIHGSEYHSFRDWLFHDEEGLPFKPGECPSLGSHLLVEFFDCDQDALKLENTVGDAMVQAAHDSKATIVEQSFHEFKPYGVSGAVIIQESHYTIHTWPEHGYAALDLFYCGGTVHVHKALDTLRERFKPGRMKMLVVRRGVENEVSTSVR